MLTGMAADLRAFLKSNGRHPVAVIGVRTGGVWIADALRRHLNIHEPPGALNIAYHRDDFERVGIHPTVEPSNLPFTITDRHILLVDDILYTGRTVRAALNEIFDYGRPASVTLAVLVDRGGRELPIRADIAGMSLSLKPREHVKLLGPDPLRLSLMKSTKTA
ncbi:MAG TPA: bifunctional pyr operon transcriptional regulator/uracil phosphoribosyltransferase PyrR [Gammaproteobacteria bacterium]|nr:bifunctional pyr operon transcriptional regulator/uracil phosphoribosyltransferase PyrR [Gammaproteobacteria bacterium]